MENASCELALRPVLYNYNPIILIFHMWRMPPANWPKGRSYTIIIQQYNHNNSSRPGNNRLPYTYNLPRGNTHFPRILCLARGNTHIPRTSVSPEVNTHFPRTWPSHYVRRPQGFGSLPTSRPGFGNPLHDYFCLPYCHRHCYSVIPS